MPAEPSPSAQELRDFYAGADWSKTDFSSHDGILADQILDLGCGSASAGIELALRGFEVTGLDLCVEPARRRMAERKVAIRLLEQDMRTMSFDSEFDAVVNWDISGIGVLGTDEQNIDVVRRIQRALVPGGKFLIETYNIERARCKGIEGLRYDTQDNRCKGRIRGYNLSLRLFALSEWKRIFSSLDFELLKVCGGRSGIPFNETGYFLIMVACKQHDSQPNWAKTPQCSAL